MTQARAARRGSSRAQYAVRVTVVRAGASGAASMVRTLSGPAVPAEAGHTGPGRECAGYSVRFGGRTASPAVVCSRRPRRLCERP